ncbi:MAG TPA: alpha/beta hydrolase [Azospirillaceae bacterium]|nr:alpha/beta hydrolase [Azospirillaceae bacterium]
MIHHLSHSPLQPHEGTVTLTDGRVLGYACYGDPAAPPVLYFHGFPGCRTEPAMINVHGVRLIAVERPGYGLSDPKDGRTLLDWPRDVAQLIETLELDRPYVVGMSGGAPYAAACAYALGDRLSGAALLAGIAPPNLGWEAGSPAGALMAMGRRPLALRLAAKALLRMLRHGDAFSAMAALSNKLGAIPGLDVRMPKPAVTERVIAGWRHALRHGVHGPLGDALVYGQPWGFDIADIRIPVAIWHGGADRTVPVAAAHAYAAGIPGARLHIREGESHFSLIFRHYGAVLADLLRHRAEPGQPGRAADWSRVA